jgi:hypothetical protein
MVGLTLVAAVTATGCGQGLEVGSNVLWSARFENGDLDEWKNPILAGLDGGSIAGGISTPSGGGSLVGVTMPGTDPTHDASKFAAKFFITGTGTLQSQSLSLSGDLPQQAYYSSWFYIPSSVTIPANGYWIIMKIRRMNAAGNESELYDFNLKNGGGGGDGGTGDLSLRLYDWDTGGGDNPIVANPVIHVGTWFQIETFYRNGSGSDGHLTVWLDGTKILEKANGPATTTSWVWWEVADIGLNLTPAMATVYADDAAISSVPVGPTGRIAR